MKKFSVILLAFWQLAIGVLSVNVPKVMYIYICGEAVIGVEIKTTFKSTDDNMVLSACIRSLPTDRSMLAEIDIGSVVMLKIALTREYKDFLEHELQVYLRLDVFDSRGKCQPSMTKIRFCGTTSIDGIDNFLVLAIEHFDHDLTVLPNKTVEEAPGFNIAMFLQLFEFVNFLKSKNLVYRDFKPENMGYNDDTPYHVHFFDLESVYEIGDGGLSKGCQLAYGIPRFLMNPNFNPGGSLYWAVKGNPTSPNLKDDAENACHVTIARVAGRLPWTIYDTTWAVKTDDDKIFSFIVEHFIGVYVPLAQPLIDLLREARNRSCTVPIDYAPIIQALRLMLPRVMPDLECTALLSLFGDPAKPLSSPSTSSERPIRESERPVDLRSSSGDHKLTSSASGSGLRSSASGKIRKFPDWVLSVLRRTKLTKSQEVLDP